MKTPHSLIPEQKENAKHGEVYFPIQKYISKLSADSPVITTHWHEEAELTLITKGSCIYQINLMEYEAGTGDILFIPPLLLHSIILKNSAEFCSETYVFHMNLLGGNNADICSARYLTPMVNHELALPYLITLDHPAYDSLREYFSQLTSLYDARMFGYELAIKSCLLQTLFLLLQYSNARSSTESDSSDKLKIVLDHIDQNYAEALSVSELAKLCYFSEYHFMRFFKKHMNMTCIQYINNIRLEKAVEFFEHGNISILEVSLSVGFHNLSYFYRAFKAKYHMTPLDFIKRLELDSV